MEFNTPVVVMEIYMELEIMIWIFDICEDYGDVVDIVLRFGLRSFMKIFILFGVQETVEIVNMKNLLRSHEDFNGDEFDDFCLIGEL